MPRFSPPQSKPADAANWRALQAYLATLATGGGATDHGALTGLTDDDHTQYLNVARHDADDHDALTITESQISDLVHYTDTDANAAIDVRVTKAYVDALGVDAATLDGSAPSAFATASHVHAAADITSGTFADALIAQSNVTQHEAALTITEAQVSDLDHTDASAIHDDVAGEIAAVASKSVPDSADVILIEDSTASNAKKRVALGTLDDAHNHDARYYTETEVDSIASGKSDTGHTHDSRYYTETEVNALAATKADSTHFHTETDISDLDHDDTDAFHQSVGSEIDNLTAATPTTADALLIEDADDSWAKKKIDIGDLPFAAGEADITVYTSNGSYIKTADVKFVRVVCIGAGGGGGGCAATSSGEQAASGGGGGGGYSEEIIPASSLSASETVTVGSGGSGGSAGNNNGSAGTSSSFGSHLSATGGSGGNGSANTSGNTRNSGGNAGVGSGGDVNLSGQRGGFGIVLSGQRLLEAWGGGNPLGVASRAGNNAQGESGDYGCGGGGSTAAPSSSATAGGNGGDGIVIVYSYG